MKNYWKNVSVIVLFYEEFVNNPMNIFEKIESKWKISFEESRKLEVINSLRKDKTKK